jgi:hypothetical protein
MSEAAQAPVAWQGAVIAVVGLYDKGKTFVLNQITGVSASPALQLFSHAACTHAQSNLPSGKKCTTKGLSFKNINVESTNFTLLVKGLLHPRWLMDITGLSGLVLACQSDERALSRAARGHRALLERLDFRPGTVWVILRTYTHMLAAQSDYFICVVNDFTSLDQRYLDKLTRSLQNSTKARHAGSQCLGLAFTGASGVPGSHCRPQPQGSDVCPSAFAAPAWSETANCSLPRCWPTSGIRK